MTTPELGDILKSVQMQGLSEDCIAIILAGSRAIGTHRNDSDIDIVLLSNLQSPPITNTKFDSMGFVFDVWTYDYEYFRSTLQQEAQNLNDVDNISLFLSILQGGKLLSCSSSYKKSIEMMIQRAQKWKWKENYISDTYFPQSVPPEDAIYQTAYNENNVLLQLIRDHLQSQKLISHRLKDFNQYLIHLDLPDISDIFDIVDQAYHEAGISREWTELVDARKAVARNDDTLAIASLRDVIRFLVRISLENPPDQLLDPSIWHQAEVSDLPPALCQAISTMYSRCPNLIKYP